MGGLCEWVAVAALRRSGSGLDGGVDEGLLIGQAELFFDAGVIGPNRVLGYAEFASDGCGGVALANEVEDFQLLVA